MVYNETENITRSANTGCIILSNEYLRDYLKKCVDLEIAVFEQQEIIKIIKEKINYYENREATPIKQKEMKTWISVITAIIGLSPSFKAAKYIVPKILGHSGSGLMDGLVEGIVYLFAFIFAFALFESIAACIGLIPHMLVYEIEGNRIKEINSKANVEIGEENDRIIGVLEDSLHKLEESKRETKDRLDAVYDLNVLTEKYQNLVAVSSIYEYFKNGRCSSLENNGNGECAYNMFEREVRQDIIIYKLDKIIDSLESIRQNQFILYSELRTMNNRINGMKSAINNLSSSVNNMDARSEVNSYYQKQMNDNIAYLKWLNDPYKWR